MRFVDVFVRFVDFILRAYQIGKDVRNTLLEIAIKP